MPHAHHGEALKLVTSTPATLRLIPQPSCLSTLVPLHPLTKMSTRQHMANSSPSTRPYRAGTKTKQKKGKLKRGIYLDDVPTEETTMATEVKVSHFVNGISPS